MPPCILYVDDHADTCDLISFVLTQAGYKVSVAACASEALEQAGREGFDLYILDNRLPDSTGLELLGRLREFDPDTPALFYSGDGLEDDHRGALESGASAYLLKPAEPAGLVDVVSRLVRLPNQPPASQ
jgi:DNA-binding response OmpR family regulator